VLDLAVIEDPVAAEVSLDPVPVRLLAELAEPATATMLATRLGLPRQNVNYHLRALERHGLVELREERRKGNVTERLLQATALSYVISPAALAAVQPDPTRSPDRLSARWLIALAARLVREVGQLLAGATRARKRLADTVTTLIGKYHDESADAGREHRVIVAVHPSLRPRIESDRKES
jgi:DNA-binding transcriptional ArsR family regulator